MCLPASRSAFMKCRSRNRGSKKLNRKNIEIRVAQRLALDLQLEVGSVSESVEVTAQGPLLETETSEKGQSFSTKFMNTLPLFTGGIRNAEAFVTYMPGVNAARGEQSIFRLRRTAAKR